MRLESKNIIDFWNSVEKFTPCQIETDNDKKPFRVENIQREVLGNYDLPWLNKERFKKHVPTQKETWVYTVFLGAIEIENVSKEIKELLNSDYPDYDLQTVKGVSCIASFQINITGFPIDNSLVIPDYFLSMGALSYKEKHPNKWLNYRKKIEDNLIDIFDNMCDELKSTKAKNVNHDHMKHLLSSFIDCANCSFLLEKCLIKNTVVIHSSKLPVSKSQDGKSENENSSIINSFFIEDLTKISNVLTHNPEQINRSLKQYLNIEKKSDELDLCQDRELINKFSNFSLFPAARWPGKGSFPLALSQQIAVNLSLKEDEGLFSVNGPPGTGKTTLLRDVISGIILKRAKVLSELSDPNDAFINPVNFQIDQYNYKAWQLKPELLGHEIFIASSNNNAVENISKEIPLLNQVDELYNIDYFSEISSYILEKPSWGLGSAALGSSKNRSLFFSKFWDKKPAYEPENSQDEAYGLEYLLNEIKPEKDWNESKKDFLKSLSDYEELESKLFELEEDLKQVSDLQRKVEELKKEVLFLQKENKKLKRDLVEVEKLKLNLEISLSSKKDSIKYHTEAKPSFIEIVIEAFSKFANYKKWREKYSKLLEEFDDLHEQIEKRSQELIILDKKTLDNEGREKDAKELLALDQEKLNKTLSIIDNYRSLIGDNFPDEEFWQLPDEKLQLRLPWNFEKLHKLRAEIFVKALDLHKAFIINTGKPTIGKNGKPKMGPLMNNLRVMKRKMSQGLLEEHSHIIPHIWASFFCVVPTVSTTFASFSNLCRELGPNSIGHLLIDEAGQAIPQAAAGAIYRSKRVIIVGDPMQIKPVITMPRSMVDALKEYHKLDNDLFNPLEQSVQTLADRENPFGTFIGKDENRKWVGCPLRIHRRCNDPMFKIANKIAYDNLMISATKNKTSDMEKTFPESLWIDVVENKSNGNWLPKEGEEVLEILSKIIRNNKLPSLYIISPFKTVASNMKKLLFSRTTSVFGSNFSKTEISSWINKSVGTIHTFQGKESEVVILLLGGNPKKPGSLNWAAKEPNILNVALTRARNLILVVGNHNSWSKRNYFQDLSFEVKKVS